MSVVFKRVAALLVAIVLLLASACSAGLDESDAPVGAGAANGAGDFAQEPGAGGSAEVNGVGGAVDANGPDDSGAVGGDGAGASVAPLSPTSGGTPSPTGGETPAADAADSAGPPLQTPAPADATEEQGRPGETSSGAPGDPVTASTPSSTPSSTPEADVEAPPSSDGPVVLTIKGDGVSGETSWTLSQLQSMSEGCREFVYSTTNNWPAFRHMEACGISLPYLLGRAGINDSAASFRFTATDGYYAVVTYDQLFGAQYSYASHSASGSSGASAVEPIVAWIWGDAGRAREESIRPFFGQGGPLDVNTSTFVQDLITIEVSSVSAGKWPAPMASIADGAAVPYGTQLAFSHESIDSVRIYYTIDGSEPDFSSPVYNPSASYFQPHLTVPLFLVESVTIKAFAAGYGRDRSETVTFSFTVE